MSEISDYKSAPFDLFPGQTQTPSNYTGTATIPGPGYTGTGLNSIPDTSYSALCGTRWNTSDGRQVVMVQQSVNATSNSIAAGLLVQAPAEITAFNNLAITVPTATPATAGTYQILVTNGSTVLNQNQFQFGYAIVSAGTGIGQILQIASHGGGSNAGTFTITTIDPILTTLDATSTITLVANPYINIVVGATGLTGAVVGATFYTIPATTTASVYNGTTGVQTTTGVPFYGFVGCHGVWGVRMDGTNAPAVGLPASASTTTAGDATVFTAAKQIIGNMAGTATSAKIAPIYLVL
jgi:hypothetical protein